MVYSRGKWLASFSTHQIINITSYGLLANTNNLTNTHHPASQTYNLHITQQKSTTTTLNT